MSRPKKGPMNLLIVDDYPTNLKLLRAQLEAEGHAVFEADDGVDALAVLERQRVDAVISDILMPQMDGYRLCHEIRKHARLRDLPIILCTASFISPGDEKLALDVGADKYLKKPFLFETLVAALHEVIAQPHAAPRAEALEEVEVLKEYSEQLVNKLEEKNAKLQAQTAALSAEIAERQRAESERLRLLETLEASLNEIYMFDPQTLRFSYVNRGALRNLGYTLEDMHAFTPLHLKTEYSEASFRKLISPLIDGEREKIQFETTHRRSDGSFYPVEIRLQLVQTGESRTFLAIILDITERKRAEVEHVQLAAIVKSSNDAIFSRGADGTILTWNAAAERMFGWSAQEAIGQPIGMLLPPERIRPLGTLIDRAPRAEPASPVQTTHVRKDGVSIQTQVTFSPVMDQQGNAIAVSNTVRDMSELMRKENSLRIYATRLRELSHRLRTVEETERHAISRELHDRIGQDLSTFGLLLASLGAKLPGESLPAVHKQLQDMQGLLKSMVANVRDVMAELRPPVLDDYGLLAALRQLMTEFAKRSGIAAELSGVDLQPRLPPIVETAMYRISQEALNNIAKHAQAKKVEISLYTAPDRVVLDITDDGIGFDANETPPDQQHWGLITMRERAEAVGIVFRLESALRAGTRIVLEAERAAT